MKTTHPAILILLNVLFWIAFVGLCIKTGGTLIAFVLSLYIPEVAKDLYMGVNLSQLYSYNIIVYSFVATLLISLTALKAYIAYLIVSFFKLFKLHKPFNPKITQIFFKISHSALITGGVAILAAGYSKWIGKKGIEVPLDWGGNELFFFAGIIYLLALVFKKGADLQTENELTV
jgi:hypothetical protein